MAVKKQDAKHVKTRIPEFPELLNVTEAAPLLNMSIRNLQLLLQRGVVPGLRIGTHWKMRRDDIEALLKSDFSPPPRRARAPKPKPTPKRKRRRTASTSGGHSPRSLAASEAS